MVTALARLVVLNDRPGLLLAYDRVRPEQLGTFDRAAGIAIDEWPEGFDEGELVRATGRWVGSQLQLLSVTPPIGAAQAVVEALDVPDRGERLPRQAQPAREFSPAGVAALRDLYEAGILSGRRLLAGSNASATVIVTVTDRADAERVIQRYSPREEFVVRQSRWTRQQLADARKLNQVVPARELSSFGSHDDDDAETHVTMTVKAIRRELADRLARLPTGLVEVTAFLRPV